MVSDEGHCHHFSIAVAAPVLLPGMACIAILCDFMAW